MERTVDQAELLLNNMLTNENNWTLPELIPEPNEPTPEPILNQLRRRGVFYFSVLKICKRQRNLWKKKVVKVNSLYRYDKAEIPPTKFASQCLDEFDNFMARQEDFNAYFGRQLKQNAYMIEH